MEKRLSKEDVLMALCGVFLRRKKEVSELICSLLALWLAMTVLSVVILCKTNCGILPVIAVGMCLVFLLFAFTVGVVVLLALPELRCQYMLTCEDRLSADARRYAMLVEKIQGDDD